MQKVVIENGKVVSATGEIPGMTVIADLGESNNGNNDETTTKTDNTDQNVGETTTGENDTKLPQTGEETNAFAQWLTITIPLMIFWLGSMLLIDREKKKITKR